MIHSEAVVFGGPGGLSHGAFFAHVAILASMLDMQFAMLSCSVYEAFKPKKNNRVISQIMIKKVQYIS